MLKSHSFLFFFFNDTATTEIYTLSLHDALPIGQKLTEAWGQPVVIDNRPGAGGNIGADAVAKSPPDGYTLFLSTNAPLTINVAAYSNIKYDPLRDFTPITVAGENAVLLVANPALPAASIKDLIAL